MEKNRERELTEYSLMIDNFAWFNKGDIMQIAKLAKKLGRNYTQDIADRKMALKKGGEAIII